jgi:hypothetical protein
MAKRRVLIVDQFSGPSPYELHLHPITFDDLIAKVQRDEAEHRPSHPSRVVEVDEETFSPQWCTTAFCADPDGWAITWRMNWDSSG